MENMRTWKEYVFERAMKAIKPEVLNSCWKNLWPECVNEFTGFTTDPIKETMQDSLEVAKMSTSPKEITGVVLIELTVPDTEAIPDKGEY